MINNMRFDEKKRLQNENNTLLEKYTMHFMQAYKKCAIQHAAITFEYEKVFGHNAIISNLINKDCRIIAIMQERATLISDYNEALLRYQKCVDDITCYFSMLSPDRIRRIA